MQRIDACATRIGPVATRVSVRDLRLEADIGIEPDEIGRLQPLIVHVTLDVAPVSADRLEETIDYRMIAAEARALAACRIALVESFATRLATTLLQSPRVLSAEVAIDKPRAVRDGLASVLVKIGRTMPAGECSCPSPPRMSAAFPAAPN